MKSLSTLLVAAAFVAVAFSGCVEQQTNPAGTSLIILPPLNTIQNPKYAISSHHRVENISVNATVPQYPLPLNLTSVVNINNVTSVFHLTSEQQKLLEENGFVVVDYGSIDDIVKPYDELKKKDVPIFVTSDTLLHLYHIQFDETLKGIEEREFFDDILGLSKALFDKAKTDYSLFTQSDLKEAARRNVAYFAVALKLLSTPTSGYNNSEKISVVDFTVPDYVKNEVNKEVDLINSHHGFSESPIFHYMEDYSQYLPRGHYTQSEKLRRYFKTLMWFGRMAFLLKGGDPHCSACDFLVSEYDARIATLQASLISVELPVLNVNGVTAENLWERIYSVTSFFVGTADDLTPYEYLECIAKVFGSEFNVTEFVNNSKLFDLKLELTKLRNPRIYGGTGECELSPDATVEDLNRVLVKTKGLRFMGQRFIP
ncbi:MAG: dTDP-glucose 4,6-dehydratase, partial [Thermoplasmata archaeon]